MSDHDTLHAFHLAVAEERQLQSQMGDEKINSIREETRDELYHNMRTRAKQRAKEELEEERKTVKNALTLATLGVRMYTQELAELDRKLAVL